MHQREAAGYGGSSGSFHRECPGVEVVQGGDEKGDVHNEMSSPVVGGSAVGRLAGRGVRRLGLADGLSEARVGRGDGRRVLTGRLVAAGLGASPPSLGL